MPASSLVARKTRGAPATGPYAPAAPTPPLVRLPALLALVLLGYVLLPRVQQSIHLMWCFGATAAGLLAWYGIVRAHAGRRGRTLLVEVVAPVRQHYVQAIVQTCVYGYWGWYWRPIYDQVPLILSQLAFGFAFDGLFAWSRGRTWRLTSGPVPIVLSTNLFIWFVDGWFALQFAMIVVALLGKEFLKWTKEGRRTHIFNPSSFGLLVAALALIATGATDSITMARPLATTIDTPPAIFLVLFGVGLVVQGFFAVTLMTFCAVATTVAVNLGYLHWSGVYLFVSSNMPAAGFLGMHLLMTDPATSPRTNVGRTLFGIGYGLGYVTAYYVLGPLGNLEIYAKLFPVPLLNLTIIALDRLARSGVVGRMNHRWETALPPARMNAVHMSVWVAFFTLLWTTGYLDTPHPGSSIAFWKRAYAEGRPHAGRKLEMVALANPHPAAINEIGILATDESHRRIGNRQAADHWFAVATANGGIDAARNLVMFHLFHGDVQRGQALGHAFQIVAADADNAPGKLSTFLLARARETGKGLKRDPGLAIELYRACALDGCYGPKGLARMALSPDGAFVNLAPVVAALKQGSESGDGECCFYLAHLHHTGRGVAQDDARARELLRRACELGFPPACGAATADPLPAFEPPPPAHVAHPPWSTAFPL